MPRRDSDKQPITGTSETRVLEVPSHTVELPSEFTGNDFIEMSVEDAGIFEDPQVPERHGSLPPEGVLALLQTEIPEFYDLWEAMKRRDMLSKGLDIHVSFPFRRVSTFYVIKQMRIAWKLSSGTYAPWRLYNQVLVTTTEADDERRPEIVSRTIWARDGKFFHKLNTFMRPSVRRLSDSLAHVMGFDSSRVDEITFPF